MGEAIIRERCVAVDGVRVHMLVGGREGDGPLPLILLHGGGLGSAALMYRETIGPLALWGPVIAPDLPGYGGSDKPDVPYTTEWYLAFLARFLDTLGYDRVQLCGLSMGGGIALGFALAYPERVERLILVGSYGLGGEIPFRAAAHVALGVPKFNSLSWCGLRRNRRVMRWALGSILANPTAITDALVDEACAHVRDGEAARAWMRWQRSEVSRGGLRTNYLAALPMLRTPTLLLHGACDRLLPVSWSERARTRIPDAYLQVFPACGHWPMREYPEAFCEGIVKFLATAPIVA